MKYCVHIYAECELTGERDQIRFEGVQDLSCIVSYMENVVNNLEIKNIRKSYKNAMLNTESYSK